jgi:hypothetical protein
MTLFPLIEVNVNGVSKKTIDPKATNKLKEMLLDRELELESIVPVEWDAATTKRALKIKEALLGNTAQSSRVVSTPASDAPVSQADFFTMDDVKDGVSDDLPF